MDPADVVVEDDKSPSKTSENNNNNDDNENEDSNRKKEKANVRKRTKTGCLTCRKRRIKCDEGRPICNNCIKSKRHCEGYNQRVIFKEPIAGFNINGSYGPIVYPPEAPNQSFNQLPNPPLKSVNGPPLAPIAPKPPQHLDSQGQPMFPYGQGFPGQHQHQAPPPSAFDFNQFSYGEQHMPSSSSIISPTSQFQAQFGGQQSNLVSPNTDSGAFVHSPTEPWRHQPARAQAHVEEMDVYPSANSAPQMDHPVEDAEFQYPCSDDDASMPDSEDAFEDLMGEESAYGQLVQSRSKGARERKDGRNSKCRAFYVNLSLHLTRPSCQSATPVLLMKDQAKLCYPLTTWTCLDLRPFVFPRERNI